MAIARPQVRRWYQTAEIVGPRRVVRTHTAISVYDDVEQAERGLQAALRGRWVPAEAIAHGVEPVGWTRAGESVAVGPTEAIARLRARGAHDAADALERTLERGRNRAAM